MPDSREVDDCRPLNIQKCKAVSYGRNVNKDYKYCMLQEGAKITVQRDDHIKDLGVTFDEKLDFGLYVTEKVNKAYSMLWLIKRNFKDIGAEAFVTLYKHLIRSHLKYNNSVWSVWSPHKKSDIEKLERVQKRATKMIPSMPKISYPDRLRKLKLPTLTYRRARGDMIETYKLLSGKYDDQALLQLKSKNVLVAK